MDDESDVMTRLLLTHAGDRIPPDGAECIGQHACIAQSAAGHNRVVTVPTPTSFHSNASIVGRALIGKMEPDFYCATDTSRGQHTLFSSSDQLRTSPCNDCYNVNKYKLLASEDTTAINGSGESSEKGEQSLQAVDKCSEKGEQSLQAVEKSSEKEEQCLQTDLARGAHDMASVCRSAENTCISVQTGCSTTRSFCVSDGSLAHFACSDISVNDVENRSARSDSFHAASDSFHAATDSFHAATDSFHAASSADEAAVGPGIPSSTSMLSLCRYAWDSNKNNGVVVQNTTQSTFNDELCDAYEKSLLDYVRTKDIMDIDREILSIHKQTVERIGCLPRNNVIRKLANCFTCKTSLPSRSLSRHSSYSKPDRSYVCCILF